jgi:hypothetical protein
MCGVKESHGTRNVPYVLITTERSSRRRHDIGPKKKLPEMRALAPAARDRGDEDDQNNKAMRPVHRRTGLTQTFIFLIDN